jgi:chromate transporter
VLTADSKRANRAGELAWVFLRLGLTAFGGPAAHIALIQRECVDRRHWIPRSEFLDLLAVSSLIPGPTSTELVMHVGRVRGGWVGLVVAGLAFIAPAAVIVGILAALYVRTGDLPAARSLLAAVQPVVVVMVLQALVPLARGALHAPRLWLIAAIAVAATFAGVPEVYVLVAAGAIGVVQNRLPLVGVLLFVGSGVVVAAGPAHVVAADVAAYFLRVGSLLFGSGYVLFPVLQGDLVERLGWLTDRELLDAIAAGQATPGPLFTTATFIGYVLGGPWVALVATVAMFAPAFLFAALSSVLLDRLRASPPARAFLDGVNAAAVALIAVVAVTLGRVAFDGAWPVLIGVVAALAIFVARVSATHVLVAAAAIGVCHGLWTG